MRHMQEVRYLPARRRPLDNDALKWAVSTYGGVDTAMAFAASYDDSHTFADYSTMAHLVLDHHVTCVGWDDGFPASRMSPPPRWWPPAPSRSAAITACGSPPLSRS